MAIYRPRRDELESQLNKGALWAVVYGDLMSYLMILFLIMLSYSLTRSVRAKPKVEQSLMQIQRVFGGKADAAFQERASARGKELSASENLQKEIDKQGLSASMEVVATEQRVRVAMKDGVLFDSGSAELKKSAKPVLEAIAREMAALPNEVRVEGHTDDVPVRGGRYSSNWELSMARAYAVLRILEAQGIPPNRLSGIGYGEYRPARPNDGVENRAKNRRIEISLLREQQGR
ncbi:MAG: flagellar motor protein MotB [Elusimicrobiota bacterium]|jgi:chemotaxis protein MotB